MLTIVGMELKYDVGCSATRNLFRHVFGYLPEHDCKPDSKKTLIQCIRGIKCGEKVCEFYGFNDEHPWLGKVPEELAAEVNLALDELRTNWSEELLILYDEFPGSEYDICRFLIRKIVSLRYALAAKNEQSQANQEDEERRRALMSESVE